MLVGIKHFLQIVRIAITNNLAYEMQQWHAWKAKYGIMYSNTVYKIPFVYIYTHTSRPVSTTDI